MPYRQFLRNQRAVEAIRQREQADVWEQARRRCRELKLPPSCALMVDAIAEKHRKLGKDCVDAPVFIGYGDGTESERRWRGRKPVERPRHPPEYPTLTEATGCSRRTMMRARKLIEGHDVLKCRRDHGERVHGGRRVGGGPRERTYVRRTRTGAILGTVAHAVGLGGCDLGGRGLANGYWPFGMDDPPAPAPRRPPPGPDGRATPRVLGEIWDRVEAERRGRRPAAPRGP